MGPSEQLLDREIVFEPPVNQPAKKTRPQIVTKKTDEVGKPSEYSQLDNGSIVNQIKLRIRIVCEILNLNKKGYRKQVKAAKRDHGMSEAQFQEYVLGLQKEMSEKK